MSSFSQVARQRPFVERARLLAIYLPEQRKDPEEMHLARPTPLQTSPAPAGQGVLEDKSSSPKVSRSIANEQAVRCRTVLLTERQLLHKRPSHQSGLRPQRSAPTGARDTYPSHHSPWLFLMTKLCLTPSDALPLTASDNRQHFLLMEKTVPIIAVTCTFE